MAFNYQSAGPTGQTPLSPTSKDVQCKSFKIDFSQTNATTAVTFDIGWLPKDAQLVFGSMPIATAISGPSVTAATIQIQVGGSTVWSGINVFAQSIPNLSSPAYYVSLPTGTDQKIQGTLTLTGGTTATAGVIYINLFYVI